MLIQRQKRDEQRTSYVFKRGAKRRFKIMSRKSEFYDITISSDLVYRIDSCSQPHPTTIRAPIYDLIRFYTIMARVGLGHFHHRAPVQQSTELSLGGTLYMHVYGAASLKLSLFSDRLWHHTPSTLTLKFFFCGSEIVCFSTKHCRPFRIESYGP